MRWRIMPLVMVIAALAHFNRTSMSVAGTGQLIPHVGISEARMGLVYSAFLLPYTLFMIPGGWFSDRFGPRRAWMILLFGAAVFVALTGVVGLLWSTPIALWGALVLVRGMLGTVNAPLHPAGARLVANWIPPSGRNLANGMITGAACVGMAVSYPIFGLLVDRLGWQQAFLTTAVVTLGVALLWTWLASDRPAAAMAGPSPPLAPGSFPTLLKNRSLLWLSLSYWMVGYFQYLFFYWSEHYFKEVRRLTTETSRLYSASLMLAMGVGMVLGGWWSDRALSRFGPRGLAVVPVLAFLLSAAAVLFAMHTTDPTLTLIWLGLAMAGVGMTEGPSWTTATLIGGRCAGTAAAIMNTTGNIGGMLAPTLTPVISAYFGWHAALGVASVVCLAGAILWLPVRPEPSREEEQSS